MRYFIRGDIEGIQSIYENKVLDIKDINSPCRLPFNSVFVGKTFPIE